MDNFKNWLESVNILQGFHVTDSQNVESILQNGFDLTKSRKYELGLGVYLAPSLWGIQSLPNQSIIECEIYNQDQFLNVKNQKQLLQFNPDEQQALINLTNYVPPNTSNSDLIKKVQQMFRGLILQRIIVGYHAEDVKPKQVVNGTR